MVGRVCGSSVVWGGAGACRARGGGRVHGGKGPAVARDVGGRRQQADGEARAEHEGGREPGRDQRRHSGRVHHWVSEPHKKGAASGFEMCFAASLTVLAAKHLQIGAGGPITRLESSIKKFQPHLIYDWASIPHYEHRAVFQNTMYYM